jgi:hypothetical protein
MCLMASILFISCKEKTYTPPNLDAVRTAEKARQQWAVEDSHQNARNVTPKQNTESDTIKQLPDSLLNDSINTITNQPIKADFK